LSVYTQLTKSQVTTFIASLDRIRGENEADEVDDKAIVGVLSESPRRNAGEAMGGLETK
jgi:hypothetical protein